ncbi:UNVERIFIED_CONTAM: hypothetical protein NCL1_50606 [Trichonephila clavipes]
MEMLLRMKIKIVPNQHWEQMMIMHRFYY